MSQIAPCPHCGSDDYVYANVRAYGWCQEYFSTPGGETDSIETDKLNFTCTALLRCVSCGKARRDVERVPGQQGIRMRARP